MSIMDQNLKDVPDFVLTDKNKTENILTRSSENGSNNSIKTCRLCVEKGEIKNNGNEKFINSCKCKGNLEFIHESCLSQWINIKLQPNYKNGSEENNISCDICKHPIKFTTTKKIRCRNGKEVNEKIKFKTAFLIFGILTTLILGGLLGGAIFVQAHVLTYNPSQGLSIGIKIAIGLLSAALLAWIITLILYYLFTKEEYVTKIESISTSLSVKTLRAKRSDSDVSLKLSRGLFAEGLPNLSTSAKYMNAQSNNQKINPESL